MGKAKHFIQANTLKNILENPYENKKNLQKIQPLTILYTIFHEKSTPFVYLVSVTDGAPSIYLV